VDASGDLTQFFDCAGQPFDGPGQLRLEINQFGWHRGLRGSEVEGQGHQPLLGAVVEIPLDPAA
jgi:hypothetical protein